MSHLLADHLYRLGAPGNFGKRPRRTFVKIHRARYEVTLREKDPARVESEIWFENSEPGTPIIDFLDRTGNAKAWLDGVSVGLHSVPAPDCPAHEYLVLDRIVESGRGHWLRVEHETLARFADDVPLFFAMSDLEEDPQWTLERDPYRGRSFLERYLPSNLEFDTYPIEIGLGWEASLPRSREHRIYSNGWVALEGSERARISFPSHWTPSAHFLLLARRDAVRERCFEHLRHLNDPNPVRVTTFTTCSQQGRYEEHAAQAFTALRELEQILGPFPFDRLLLFSTPSGRMEYAGAAEVCDATVLHELAHSYFGRTLAPANGDAGWFDEAVVSWIHGGRRRSSGAPRPLCDIGNRGPHHRRTSSHAYRKGEAVIAHLAHSIDRSLYPGGLEGVLRDMLRLDIARPLRAIDFEEILSSLTRERYDALFERVIYNGKRPAKEIQPCQPPA